MKRKIIEIDEALCNGCGKCASACHEGAIGIINGKARLLRDDYCDGLGDCLPACPMNAITFTEREALAYNEAAVLENKLAASATSKLGQWPCQIKLLPITAPYFNNADLLIAADCTAYAYPNMHNHFMKDKITIIGCTKLDNTDYSQKLAEIFKNNSIRSITIVRMVVPCCGGMVYAVEKAIEASGKEIELKVHTISIDGKLM